jgi:membrane protein YqaA with SNARE-associated domain
MLIALLAAVCMLIQDSLSVIKYQAASRNKGLVAAMADTIIWMVMITSTTIAAFTLHAHDMREKIIVVVLVSAANIGGNLIGVWMGKKFVKDEENMSQDARLTAIENKVQEIIAGGNIHGHS